MSDHEYNLILIMLSHVVDGTEAHGHVREFLRNPTEPSADQKLQHEIRQTFEDHVHVDVAVGLALKYIEELTRGGEGDPEIPRERKRVPDGSGI
jgi:hypothetical protein